jgi:CMD domain protein
VTDYDVLDHALEIRPGDRLDTVRRARSGTRENAQLSYEAIFEPTHPGNLSIAERFALALAVVRFHGDTPLEAHYAERFAQHEGRAAVAAALESVIAAGGTAGPFGHYRETGLAAESTDGLHLAVSEDARLVLGDELSALIEHVHLLVYRPRESSADALQRLLDEGWTTTELVAVSQLVAFLSFQIRLATGLSVLRSSWENIR